jgi:hypothetical protein
MKYLVILALTLTGCGAAVATDSPPEVGGIYYCAQNCSSPCYMSGKLHVNQTGSEVLATAVSTAWSPALHCSGSIDNNGHFSALCTGDGNQSCDGDFANGRFSVICTVSGTTCQEATYIK